MAISEQIIGTVANGHVFVILQIVLVVTVVAWFVNYRFKRRRLYELMDKIPGPKGLPIIGTALEFGLDDKEALIPKLKKWFRDHGSPFRLWLGPDALVGISDPEQISKLLNSNATLNKGPRFAKAGRAVLGDGILFSEAKKWKPRRKLIASTFSPKILESFMPIFVKQSNILVQQLKQEDGKGTFDAWTYFSKASLDAICGTAMGINLNAQLEDSSYLKAAQANLEIIGIRIFKVWTYIDFLFNISHYGKIFRDSFRVMQEFTEKVIVLKKEQISHQESYNIKDIGFGKNPAGRAFLDYILELTRYDETYSIQDIKEEVDTIMLTGFETTANTLCFCMLTLGFYPECQQKLYDEVYRIFGDSDRPIEYEDLQSLPYTEQFIKETLRMYPTVFIFFRHLEQEFDLNGTLIPIGTQAAFLICCLHSNPNVWPNPEKFDPERFTPEEIAKRHPCSFVPFAAGPRNCVGFKYAMISIKTFVASIVRNYIVSTEYTPETLRIEFGSTLKAKDGYKIQVKSRKVASA